MNLKQDTRSKWHNLGIRKPMSSKNFEIRGGKGNEKPIAKGDS